MSRRAGPVGIAMRAGTTTPVLSLLAVLLVAATAFIGAASPGLLQQVQSDSLRYALAKTDPTQRDFVATTRGAPATGGSRGDSGLPAQLESSWGRAVQALDDARTIMDPLLAEVLAPARVVAAFDGSESVTLDPKIQKPRSQLYLRLDPQLDERVRIVDGDRPAAGDEDGAPLEFALTAAAARDMAWELGEERDLPRGGGVLQRVVLVGIYEPVDSADPDWQHAPLGLAPSRVQRGLELPLFSAVAFVAPEGLDAAAIWSDSIATEAWYPLDLAGVRADRTRDLIAAMRQFTAQGVAFDVAIEGFFDDGLQFRSSAPTTLDQTLLRVEATAAMVSLIATGPLAVAVVVLALTARMLALRRRATLQLAAARGASVRLRAGVLAIEGALLGGVGAVAGGVPGAMLGQGSGVDVWVVPVLAGVTLPTVLPVLGLLVARRRARADLGSSSAIAARRRLAVELGVVVLATVATVLVALGARSQDSGSPDPLVTALPLLLAAVGCVATLRLVPLVLGVIERRSDARRGLIALIGPARARRDPTLRVAPVLAVVVGVAIAVFSVAFSSTVDAGIRVAAGTAVGADMRVQAPYLGEDQLAAIDGIDGVRATAPVYAGEPRAGALPGADLTVMVYVIDVAELRAVQGDPETAIPLPDALLEADGDVPVIASDELAARIGDETLELEGEAVRVVGSAPTQTPLGSTRNWVAVDRSRADDLLPTTFSPSVVLVALDPGADATAVAEAARSIGGTGAIAVTPASVAATRLEDPALRGLQSALLAAIGVVALLLALAIGMTLVLGAPARGRLLALLGALGFRRSRELALVVWEVAPAVAVALPVGALVGLALPFAVVPALDLTGFVGGGDQPEVRLGGVLPALVVLGFLGVTVVAVLVAALVARRVTAAGTLRSIDEEG